MNHFQGNFSCYCIYRYFHYHNVLNWKNFNTLPESSRFWWSLMTFANNSDSDEAQQNVRPHLRSNLHWQTLGKHLDVNIEFWHILKERKSKHNSTLSQLLTPIMPYSNSLDPGETPSDLTPHQDPSYLTLNIFTNFEQHWSTLKLKADEKFSRQQFRCLGNCHTLKIIYISFFLVASIEFEY